MAGQSPGLTLARWALLVPYVEHGIHTRPGFRGCPGFLLQAGGKRRRGGGDPQRGGGKRLRCDGWPPVTRTRFEELLAPDLLRVRVPARA